jgi:transposase
MPGAGWARSQSNRRRDRQSEREERRKRGACIDPNGYDAGKKIKGKKRHILVDTTGLLMHAVVHSADIQDRDGGAMLMGTLFGLHPLLLKLYADGGYQGPVFQNAMKDIMAQVNVEIVKRSDKIAGFAVLPKRWVVERTLAWLNRCRRLAKDWECLNRKARVYLLLASIRLMVRRLGRNEE